MTPEGASLRALVGRSLILDRVTGTVCRNMAEQGIDVLLLKGPALVEWLYADGAVRPYGDIDLLVRVRDFAGAEKVLRAMDFVPIDEFHSAYETPHHAITFKRLFDGAVVDLHRCLASSSSIDVPTFDVLAEAHSTLVMGDHEVWVPEVARLFLIVVLHAAQHGREEAKPLRDLERAADRVTREVVSAAAEIAVRLGLEDPFRLGLELNHKLAHHYSTSLPRGNGASALARARAMSSHKQPGVLPLVRMHDLRGMQRLRLLVRLVWPTREFLASRETAGKQTSVLRMRARRLLYQCRHLPGAVRGAWLVRKRGTAR